MHRPIVTFSYQKNLQANSDIRRPLVVVELTM